MSAVQARITREERKLAVLRKDIGALASIPVMEGKAILFKNFAGIDAFPIAVTSKDPSVIVDTVARIEPVFGGINLEDISAPRCFEVEERLKKILKIPVFHDDQHGTAVVALAALINALKVVGKRFDQVKVAVSGAGAAGIAVTKFLYSFGVKDAILCDSRGIISRGRPDLNPAKRAIAESTNPRNLQGSLADAMAGADVFLGLSVAGIVTPVMVESMNRDAIVFAMANPVPEILYDEALLASAGLEMPTVARLFKDLGLDDGVRRRPLRLEDLMPMIRKA